MRPIRPIAALWRLCFFIVSFSAFQLVSFSQDAPATDADLAYQRFRSGTLDVRTLAEVLPQMADPERRSVIRTTLLEAKSPPRTDLVALLQHPVLAVRLGALELLEELVGGDFSYNPWLPADSPENLAAFSRWKTWVGEPVTARASTSLYSMDQRRSYLRDILGEDADKGSRARRMLEAEGLSALGFLESFLTKTPTLTPGGRAKIREAQYQITLTRQLGDQAAITARHLAFGSRDQLLSALSATRTANLLALPILRDFITHPDPLVRETAIDSLLIVGGDQAIAIVAPLLAAEPDVNVIHGALRRLKDIRGPATVKLVASFLTHADEDLLVSAIQASITVGGDNDSFSPSGTRKKTTEVTDAVIRTLSDPRWRVRAAALEYIARTRSTKAKAACLVLLDDPDEFVRFAAIHAIVAMGAKEALPKLKAMFLADESMAGPVIEGYGALKSKPDAELLTKLDAASLDAKLAVIRAVKSETLYPIVLRYAVDANMDVACAALRFIAASNDLLKTNTGTAVIVTALRSGNPEKIEAVLERLSLRASGRVDPLVLSAIGSAANAGEPTALDPLYDAFMVPGGEQAPAPVGPKIPAAQAELLRELGHFAIPEIPPGIRFHAALNLASAGQAAGYSALLRDFTSFTTAQKIAICEGLHRPSKREAVELLGKLLRDPIPEVRSAAARCALSEEKARALIQLVLDELAKPDALLQPHEVYNSSFASAARDRSNITLFSNWCLSILNAPKSASPLRILAVIAAGNSPNTSVLTAIKKHTNSPDHNLRRAAWRALLTARPAELSDHAATIAADPVAFVREVLPTSSSKEDSNHWIHRFSDTHADPDAYWNSNRTKPPRLNEPTRVILQRLASKDPSPLIRFEASFALLTQGVTTDLDSLAALIPRLSKETNAPKRIARWLEANAARATPALSPLLAVVPTSSIDAKELKELLARIQPQQTKGFATFASLAESAAAPDAKTQPVLIAESAPQSPVTRNSLEVVFFYKPGCPECLRAQQEFTRLTADFPLLKVTEYNIIEASGTVFNQALCVRFSVPSLNHTVSPAIFTQTGFLIRDAITPRAMGELLAKTMTTPQDDSWMRIDEEEQQAASMEVTRRYEAFTLPVVIGAGLLDGVNPCAFATIIFFLSYLRVVRRTPREMLMVGAAFISAVFIAYLAVGLLLHGMLKSLNEQFATVQYWMNLGFGALALVASFLSFRDAFRARSGRLGEMTLQLPGFLKERIRSVVRTGARARNFVVAAFVSGILISLLELACTGQVYAPIIYQIQRGNLDAVLWLVLYNLAFIAPLVVIFLLAYGGLRSETLIDFQRKHTAAVKIALGILFLVLALVIFLGQKMLG